MMFFVLCYNLKIIAKWCGDDFVAIEIITMFFFQMLEVADDGLEDN